MQYVNEHAVESFKTEDSIDQLFAELQKVFLPCFYQLVCSTAVKDRDAVDQVRGCWCEVLSIDLPGSLLYLLCCCCCLWSSDYASIAFSQ